MSIISFSEMQEMINERRRIKSLLAEGKSTYETYIETLEESVRLLEEQAELNKEVIHNYKEYVSLLQIQAKHYEQIIQEKDALISQLLSASHNNP